MYIPDKVKIGFKDYKVNKIDGDVVFNNSICYGAIKYDDGVIDLMNIDLSEDMKKCALIHECLHGIDDLFKIGLTEEQVEQLGKGLYGFIKDNPQVFKGD